MQNLYRPYLVAQIIKRLKNNPVVALLGARQVGKSTLAREVLTEFSDSLYIDLEKESERRKVESDPELFLQANRKHLICFDEIQFLPNIFVPLRAYIDENNRNAQFLVLGSASRDLIKQSSESLAGRIAFIEVHPFHYSEVEQEVSYKQYWLKGGYPRSVLQRDTDESLAWRENYIRTFLERDLPQLGFTVPATKLHKFWRMLAHYHCQLVNFTNIGKSLDLSHHTIKSYIDILEQTFVLKTLPPYHANERKRLVKSPKVYIRDSGLLHALLGIENYNDLLGHPMAGNSFESSIIENILRRAQRWNAYFYRDSSGNEVDLVLEKGRRRIAIEIKLSTAPRLENSFWNAVKALEPSEMYCIAQVNARYPGERGLKITNIRNFLSNFEF